MLATFLLVGLAIVLEVGVPSCDLVGLLFGREHDDPPTAAGDRALLFTKTRSAEVVDEFEATQKGDLLTQLGLPALPAALLDDRPDQGGHGWRNDVE